MVVKLSAEQIQALGGMKNAAEFSEKFNAILEAANAPKTEQKVVSLDDVQAIFKAQLESLNQSVAKLDATVKTIDPEALIAKAETAGAAAAAKALGAVGASGAGADKGAANDGVHKPSNSDALIAEGRFEEAWQADKNLQAEFSNPKVFAAYKKAELAGKIRIN